MEYLSCELCGVASYSENLHMQHVFSKKHIQNSRNAVILDNSVHVTGFTFHTNMKELYDHFSKYGRVKFVDMIQGQGRKKKPNFAFVEFDNAASVESALAARHHVNGRMIYVNRRQRPIAKENPVDLELLQNCKSVQEQIDKMYSTLKLSEEDTEKREKLRAMVEAEVKQYFPNCSINLFGSSVNGFGCKGCDVDLLFQTGVEAPAAEDDADENRKPPDIPTVNQIRNGDVSLEVLNKLTKTGQLQFIRRALLHQREEYLSVVYIPAITCPIVKFLSKTHSLRCDLSNGHSLPLRNTALLKFFGQYDSRVSPLMTVLRRWAKINDYIGTQPFSSYTFTLMVIFFLQTRNPPVLPSVNFLKSRTNVKNITNGFDCSFCSDPSKIEPSRNRQSLEQLLLEFFVFYKDYDFFEYVICPLTGRSEPKAKFDPEKNPDMGKFKMSYICIQDPFETTRNCASNMKFAITLAMVDHFKKIVEEFRNKPEPDDTNSNKTWGLSQLLGAASRRLTRPIVKRNSFSFSMTMSQKMLQSLREEFGVTDGSQNALLSEVWVYDMTNIVLDVLRHVLLLECEIIDAAGNNWCSRKRKMTAEDGEATPSKVLRADGMGSVNDNRSSVACSVNGNIPGAKKGSSVIRQHAGQRAPDIRSMPHFAEFVAHSKNASEEPFLCAQVAAYHKTWINRMLPTPELMNTGLENFLESQRTVSLDLVNDVKVKLKNEGKFFCEFFKCRKAGYTILDIKVDAFGMDRSSFQLFKFLKMFMRKIVESQV